MDRSARSFKGAVLNGNAQVVRRSSECRIRVKSGKAQCEHIISALPPESGHREARTPCPKRAKSDHNVLRRNPLRREPPPSFRGRSPQWPPSQSETTGVERRRNRRPSHLVHLCCRIVWSEPPAPNR